MRRRKPAIPLVSDPETSTSLTPKFINSVSHLNLVCFLKTYLNIRPVIYRAALQALLWSHSACKSVGMFIDSSSSRKSSDPNAERTQQGCV
jgi:hypothetical protein